MDRKEAEKLVAEWYADGTKWGEAKAQRMESWLEYDDEDFMNLDLSDVRGDTLYWLEEMMKDCSSDDLKPGEIYHWMVIAYEEGGG